MGKFSERMLGDALADIFCMWDRRSERCVFSLDNTCGKIGSAGFHMFSRTLRWSLSSSLWPHFSSDTGELTPATTKKA
jgi:hypothetical protein